MVATGALEYDGKRIAPGVDFFARSETDAFVLEALKRARRHAYDTADMVADESYLTRRITPENATPAPRRRGRPRKNRGNA